MFSVTWLPVPFDGLQEGPWDITSSLWTRGELDMEI